MFCKQGRFVSLGDVEQGLVSRPKSDIVQVRRKSCRRKIHPPIARMSVEGADIQVAPSALIGEIGG